MHSQSPAPEHDDQRAQPEAVAIVAGPAHHRDNRVTLGAMGR